MVAYSFNPRFEVAVREGWKTQTIRAARKRHAHPGEMLQLFCGMRTAQCRKICEDVRCTEVMKVVITFQPKTSLINYIVTDDVKVLDLDAFAVRDGFTDIEDMSLFWLKSHGPIRIFQGVLIEWAAPRAPFAPAYFPT